MSRPYNNPFSKHIRRVAALARLKPPALYPRAVLDEITKAWSAEDAAGLRKTHEEGHARNLARFEKEKATLEARITQGGRS